MSIPRWTVYPAVVVLGALLVTAIPHDEPDPYEGAAASALEPAAAPTPPVPADTERVVVLGIDGMDPDILRRVLERYPDRMPNFRWLVEQGSGIHSLGTSTPPQSPVAWSNFITGLDPGGHGIFDFIHRDPMTRGPASSTTRTGEEPWKIPLGSYRVATPFPLGMDAGGTNRTGEAFWTTLRDHGIAADVWRMPINFPVEESMGWSFPGMMTPALDSAYGQCSFWTTSDSRTSEVMAYNRIHRHKVSDVKIEQVREDQDRVNMGLKGPMHTYKVKDANGHEEPVQVSAPIKAYIDRGERHRGHRRRHAPAGAPARSVERLRAGRVPDAADGARDRLGDRALLPAQHRAGVRAVLLAGQRRPREPLQPRLRAHRRQRRARRGHRPVLHAGHGRGRQRAQEGGS